MMTRHITISLDLNENDYDAFQCLLNKKSVVAQVLAPADYREQARIIDVLDNISDGVTRMPVQWTSAE